MKQHEALALARKYKELLQQEHIPFLSVIVFGSAARGNMHKGSDIDIAVIGKPFKGDRMKEMLEVRKLRIPISFKIQPIWFYPEHLENKYSTLAQQIKKEGVFV